MILHYVERVVDELIDRTAGGADAGGVEREGPKGTILYAAARSGLIESVVGRRGGTVYMRGGLLMTHRR